MSIERNVLAISAMSPFDMIEGVRASHMDDAYHELVLPSQDMVQAFETAMEQGPKQEFHVVQASATEGTAFETRSLELAANSNTPMLEQLSFAQAMVAPETVHDAHTLPSPASLVAESARHVPSGMAEEVFSLSEGMENTRFNWLSMAQPSDQQVFDQAWRDVNAVLTAASQGLLSHHDLLELQFAMGKIKAYNQIGLQISQKYASAVETLLSSSEG